MRYNIQTRKHIRKRTHALPHRNLTFELVIYNAHTLTQRTLMNSCIRAFRCFMHTHTDLHYSCWQWSRIIIHFRACARSMQTEYLPLQRVLHHDRRFWTIWLSLGEVGARACGCEIAQLHIETAAFIQIYRALGAAVHLGRCNTINAFYVLHFLQPLAPRQAILFAVQYYQVNMKSKFSHEWRTWKPNENNWKTAKFHALLDDDDWLSTHFPSSALLLTKMYEKCLDDWFVSEVFIFQDFFFVNIPGKK